MATCKLIPLLLAALAVFTACGGSPAPSLATAKTVFIGDSITVVMSRGSEFAAHSNWINKGISGQNSAQMAARFQTDVINLHPAIVHILAGTNDVYDWWKSPCSMTARLLPWWYVSETDPEIGYDDCSTLGYMVQRARSNGIQVIIGTIPPWGTVGNESPTATMCAQMALQPTIPFPYSFACADASQERYTRIHELNAWLAALPGVTVVDYHSALVSGDGMTYQPQFTEDGVHPNADGAQVMFSGLLSTPLR